ncbi:VOC family protein [Chondrinema litorale]|uniref:VOC family protein n=1 Tax=Chondrinema litorale TaxID=2994555 RepID=UPI00254347C8|nr:VOC family protein [Chondrinema litorale]UZR93815.1 glyoxalase/bleomycin resistance/extradiol dioxygenase family protein [Chondrinema litorale]
MKLNLLVIKTENPEMLKMQYECFGISFEYHQHGKEPFHYAAEIDGLVFEIYPLPKSIIRAESFNKANNLLDQTRLGFTVRNLDALVKQLEASNWEIISTPKEMPWGKVAIIADLDGRKVELKETL